jgi:hypothetical protein
VSNIKTISVIFGLLPNAILKINATGNGFNYLILIMVFYLLTGTLNNYKASDGRLFIGGQDGYYMFKPEEINV